MTHDFDFRLGKDRALRGKGWRGLAALAIFLMAVIAVISIAGPTTDAVARLF